MSRLQPFSVIVRAGVWSYRLKGWKSGRYESLSLADDGTKATEKKAWALAGEEFKKSDDVKTGNILLRDYAEKFYGPDCPHCASLRADGGSITERTMKQFRDGIWRDLLGRQVEGGKKRTVFRKELAIMSLRVREIRPKDVQDAKKELVAANGLSRASYGAFNLLRTILSTAYKAEMVARDPLLNIKAIKYEKASRDAFTSEDTDRFFQRENFRSDLAYALFRLAYLTGMRRAEICALDRSQDKGDTLVIDRAWKDDDFKVIGPPKWGKVREVSITKPIRELLDWWYAKAPFVHGGLVFTGYGSGPVPPSFWRNQFRYALKAAGITGVVPHSLRHTMATDLDEQGVPGAIIRDSLGWGDETIQRRYTHVRQDRKLAVMEQAMGKIVNK